MLITAGPTLLHEKRKITLLFIRKYSGSIGECIVLSEFENIYHVRKIKPMKVQLFVQAKHMVVLRTFFDLFLLVVPKMFLIQDNTYSNGTLEWQILTAKLFPPSGCSRGLC